MVGSNYFKLAFYYTKIEFNGLKTAYSKYFYKIELKANSQTVRQL